MAKRKRNTLVQVSVKANPKRYTGENFPAYRSPETGKMVRWMNPDTKELSNEGPRLKNTETLFDLDKELDQEFVDYLKNHPEVRNNDRVKITYLQEVEEQNTSQKLSLGEVVSGINNINLKEDLYKQFYLLNRYFDPSKTAKELKAELIGLAIEDPEGYKNKTSQANAKEVADVQKYIMAGVIYKKESNYYISSDEGDLYMGLSVFDIVNKIKRDPDIYDLLEGRYKDQN